MFKLFCAALKIWKVASCIHFSWLFLSFTWPLLQHTLCHHCIESWFFVVHVFSLFLIFVIITWLTIIMGSLKEFPNIYATSQGRDTRWVSLTPIWMGFNRNFTLFLIFAATVVSSWSTFLTSQQFCWFSKQYGLTDQALLIHRSAQNFLILPHVLSITAFCIRI
jgi:hypothetical protein